MTTRRPLFLEGNRIVDADGNTVRELSAEGRMLALRIARGRALMKQQIPPEEDPFLGPILAQARRRVERLTPEERDASRERVEAYMADVRRRSAALLPQRLEEHARGVAVIEKAIPDDTTERFPLTD